LFNVGVTFEMIGLNTEKCVFRLIKIMAAQRLINGRRQGKVAERQRERMRVRASVGRNKDSVGQHSYTMWEEIHMEIHLGIKKCGGGLSD
jgi:hypothetical protein